MLRLQAVDRRDSGQKSSLLSRADAQRPVRTLNSYPCERFAILWHAAFGEREEESRVSLLVRADNGRKAVWLPRLPNPSTPLNELTIQVDIQKFLQAVLYVRSPIAKTAQASAIQTWGNAHFQKYLKLLLSRPLYFLSKVQSFRENAATEKVQAANRPSRSPEVWPKDAAKFARLPIISDTERTACQKGWRREWDSNPRYGFP